jgi:translation initiation factor IF-2
MEQLRVVDLAHTMGITSRELIFKLRSIGVTVAGEEDTLDLATVRAIITGETLQRRPREVIVRREKTEEETTTISAKDRLARRRKRQVVETDKEIKEVVTEAKAAEAEVEEEVALVADAVVEEAVEVDAVADEIIEEEIELKPEVEITEEEITAEREVTDEEEAPKRVRPARAKTPLEQSLRELTEEEIRQRLADQKEAAKKAKTEKVADRGAGRKAKAAADAKEIRDLLNKFEEQKLKGQEEAKPSARPAPRPGAARPSKKARRRKQDEERRAAPPRPTRTVQFRDGEKPEGPIILSEMVTARELAEKLNVTAKELLGLLIQKGMMVTTNQSLPHELAEEICADLGVEAMVASAEELIEYEREEAAEVAGPEESRPPVVTVMGHVDHGKTSLLDAIRSSRVAEQEAGGITQHIGASRIEASDGRVVVFVDTPGHEAFTQMRARGAQVTDIVILVVAADDGVMPQTKEAITHARAANVPLIVAINKIDKSNANPDRVKQQLAENDVLVESWGGEIPSVDVSAKKNQGLDDLLDMILLVAEMKELKAVAEGPARGVVLEARKEKGRGIVSTVLIQQGQLKVGDYFFSGSTWGRVRAIADDTGERIDVGGPSDPVEITGFEDVPAAGDILQATESEAKALEVASFRSQRDREEGLQASRKVSLDNLFDTISESEIQELNVVIKGDVQGSVEVLRETLISLGTEKVKINVLQGSVGAITTNDVMLASASNAIIIGFAVRPERTARELAETEQVDIRLYTVIYDLVDDIRKAMVGLLEPEYREEELGHAEVREIFKVPKIGAIAGSHVIDGVITRSAKVRLLRDHVVIYEGELASLKRFKDDASEVREGFDCGIGLARYQDIKEGDIIEAYKMVEIAPEL